jgi:hypothetical protein
MPMRPVLCGGKTGEQGQLAYGRRKTKQVFHPLSVRPLPAAWKKTAGSKC